MAEHIDDQLQDLIDEFAASVGTPKFEKLRTKLKGMLERSGHVLAFGKKYQVAVKGSNLELNKITLKDETKNPNGQKGEGMAIQKSLVHIGSREKNGKTWMVCTFKDSNGKEKVENVFDDGLKAIFKTNGTGPYSLSMVKDGNFWNIGKAEFLGNGAASPPASSPPAQQAPQSAPSTARSAPPQNGAQAARVEIAKVCVQAAADIATAHAGTAGTEALTDLATLTARALMTECRNFITGKAEAAPVEKGKVEGA